MKNNLDKLNDAVGMLDEKTVKEAMDVGVRHRRTVHRRAVALIAACLALILVAGGLVAVPLLSAPEPVVETSSDGPATVIARPGTEPELGLGYTEYPLVKLSTVSEVLGVAEEGFTAVDIKDERNFVYRVSLSFDIAEGETVTVYFHQESGMSRDQYYTMLNACQYTSQAKGNMEYTNPFDKGLVRARKEGTEETEGKAERLELSTLTAEKPVLEWVHGSTYQLPEQVVLDYVVRNQEEQITGAGSVLVSHHRLIQNQDHPFYDKGVIVRGADLGSVRFADPADTTEEATVEYLDGLHDKIDGAYAALDFTPVTENERYVAGWSEIINTCFDSFPKDHMIMSGFGGSSMDMYRVFHISVTPKDEDVSVSVDGEHLVPTETLRIFIIFNDGSWGEVAEDEGWRYSEEDGHRESRRITFTDGRVVELRLMDFDGVKMVGPVYITEGIVTDQG